MKRKRGGGGGGVVDWREITKNRVQWRGVVSTVTQLPVSLKDEQIISCTTVIISGSR
jgi:hypothetical protein